MTGARTFFVGGARSGKSRLAQLATERHDGPLHYCATAEAWDEEMADRIAHHRRDRGDRWRTIDCPVTLPQAVHDIGATGGQDGGAILIDCLTLWLSNLMLADHDIAARSDALLDAIRGCPLPVYIVSNEVGMGIVPDHPLGRRFRDAAGRLNQQVAAIMHDVYLVIAGMVLPLQPFTPIAGSAPSTGQ